MKGFIAKFLCAAFCAVAALPVFGADKVAFEVSAPLTVAVGEAFRVEFALNANPDKDSFVAPSFEGFDVLAGPAVSKGSSIQIVNGSMTKSVNYTITFVLLPQSAGNVTVGPAEIAVDGTAYRTRPLAIEVVSEPGGGSGAAQPGADASAGRQSPQQSAESAARQQIAKDDILLRAIVSRTSVYKGEPLRGTL